VIRTLVVDDDFRVAAVHAGFVKEVRGFDVVGIAHTAAEARARVRELAPDLVLLDVYLPDESAAFRAGALNYLIKPFTTRQLTDRLTSYARYRQLVGDERNLDQEQVDRAFQTLHEQDRTGPPKGLSSATAGLVSAQLRNAAQPLSAAEIAAELGIARATAQRYLTTMADAGTVEKRLRYGAAGRPEHEYLWRSTSGTSMPS
jgi:two-component system CitB family response regulator